MKHFAIAALAIALSTFAGISFAQDAARLGDLAIEKPWARASIGISRPAAAYLSIRNDGIDNDTLMIVSTPVSGMADVHSMSLNNGIMSMAATEPIIIPAGGTITLAPGGLHIMMMNLRKPLIKGESIDLTLSFNRAGKITVTAPIYGPGATQPE